jgi:hypothetical protein
MANKVLLKKSSVGARVPVVGDLDYGELALNYADGKLYYKTSGNTIDTFSSLSATATLTNKTLSSATLTGTLTAGGGVGTNGQVLQSTGTGVQWATVAGGSGSGTVTSITAGTGLTGGTITTTGTIAIDSTVATLTGTQTLTNKTLTSPTINSGAVSGTFTGAPTFSDTTASTSSTTGAVKIGGGLGVVGNIYVGSASKVGFVNASNVSAVYQYYNAATNSLDTVFG